MLKPIKNDHEDLEIKPRVKAIQWLMIIFSIGLTFVITFYSKKHNDIDIKNRFERDTNQLLELISERLVKYEDALWSGVSTIQTHEGDISYEKWKVFFKSSRIHLKYPGINGIGIIRNIHPSLLKKYLSEQKKSRPEFHIHPKHNRQEFWPITYIEPSFINAKAVGLDMAHETNRYQAAVKARDTGIAQITGPIILVQDLEKTPGFLFYAPFYKGGIYNTEEKRQQNFMGLVYAPFVFKNIMKGILEKSKRNIGIRILDSKLELYNELHKNEMDFDPNPLFKTQRSVEEYGRTWTFDIWSSQSFREKNVHFESYIALGAGIIINILIIWFFILLARDNKKMIILAKNLNFGFIAKTKDLNDLNDRLQIEITERRKAEFIAHEANMAKSNFLARMSHEIRTPLNGIVGCSDILTGSDLNDEDKKLIDMIVLSSDRLKSTVDEILDFSKIQNQGLNKNLSIFEIIPLIEESCAIVEKTKTSKRNNFKIDINSDVPKNIFTDKGFLERILLNLLSNSNKHTESGKISINVSSDREDRGDIWIKFKVSDTGDGIDKNYLNTIFDPFSQEDESLTRKHDGTGLGMPIVKELVSILGGDIQIESQKNIGTDVTFTICTKDCSAENPDALYEEIENNDYSNLSKEIQLKILLVDDDDICLATEGTLLKNMGYETDMAVDGQDALRACEKIHYDLVLMDIRMPVMNGIEATKEILKLTSKKPPIIIATTGDATVENIDNCLEVGMTDFISKPFRRKEIAYVLKKYFVVNN